jgi:hypothetical protein
VREESRRFALCSPAFGRSGVWCLGVSGFLCVHRRRSLGFLVSTFPVRFPPPSLLFSLVLRSLALLGVGVLFCVLDMHCMVSRGLLLSLSCASGVRDGAVGGSIRAGGGGYTCLLTI